MQTFEEIIAFAIERENEAAEFYRRMQSLAKLPSSKLLLEELEKMEIQHAELLKQFTSETVHNFEPTQIEELNISDYMVEINAGEDMTFQEILILAIKLEDIANRMYSGLISLCDNEDLKKLLNKLALEEKKHKQQLEIIYDNEIFKEN